MLKQVKRGGENSNSQFLFQHKIFFEHPGQNIFFKKISINEMFSFWLQIFRNENEGAIYLDFGV